MSKTFISEGEDCSVWSEANQDPEEIGCESRKFIMIGRREGKRGGTEGRKRKGETKKQEFHRNEKRK